jgi:hypothetical protein
VLLKGLKLWLGSKKQAAPRRHAVSFFLPQAGLV